MTTTREARHLSGNDIGKTLTVDDHHGIIDELYFNDHSVSVYLRGGTSAPTLSHSTVVTITGTDTPPGLNLHRSVIDQEQA